MRYRVREMTVTMSALNKKLHMSVSSLATCAMNALVTEYPHDWKQMPDIERRRLVNMCWCNLLPDVSPANDVVTRVSSHARLKHRRCWIVRRYDRQRWKSG